MTLSGSLEVSIKTAAMQIDGKVSVDYEDTKNTLNEALEVEVLAIGYNIEVKLFSLVNFDRGPLHFRHPKKW